MPIWGMYLEGRSKPMEDPARKLGRLEGRVNPSPPRDRMLLMAPL